MHIELSLFIGICLSVWVLFAFFLEYLNSKRTRKLKKKMHLVRRECEVCASTYFVSVFSNFWRCPLCNSINKEKQEQK